MADQQKCTNFSEFIAVLDNGQLHQKLTGSLQKIAEEMSNFAADNGGGAKAELKLHLKFKLDKGIFEITAHDDVKLPEVKPDRCIFWLTPDNMFSIQNPQQIELFNGPRPIRDGYGEAATVRG